jgi:hypothetical protein
MKLNMLNFADLNSSKLELNKIFNLMKNNSEIYSMLVFINGICKLIKSQNDGNIRNDLIKMYFIKFGLTDKFPTNS